MIFHTSLIQKKLLIPGLLISLISDIEFPLPFFFIVNSNKALKVLMRAMPN